jgi:capsular polysaccharide biosynthesis protein
MPNGGRVCRGGWQRPSLRTPPAGAALIGSYPVMPSDITDLPIDEAAHEVLELERSAPLGGAFAVTLGDSFTNPDLRSHFARQERTGAIRLYRLRDMTLDASLMLLLRGRRRITETRYLVTDEEYAATLVKPLPAAPLDPTEHYIIGCNRVWHNYYHWLIQSLPAIDLGLRHRTHRKVTLVLSSLRPWQQETLALLGYQDVPRLTLQVPDTFLLPSAEFSDSLGERMPRIIARAAIATFRRLSEAVPWGRGAAAEIYVARTDARNRVAVNEAELIDLLERQGVRIVVPGALSVAEQIAAFRAARLVIGPHGAGMSSIVFCQSGSFIYEMLPRHYPNVAFNRLAQAAGLNYCADLFDIGREAPVHERTWHIDLDLVAARLDAIRARMAVTPRLEPAMVFLKRTQAVHPDDAAAPVAAAPDAATGEPQRRRSRLARLFAGGRGR